MSKKDTWLEIEDDNIDFKAIHERNKDKTVAELEKEFEEAINNLKLENA